MSEQQTNSCETDLLHEVVQSGRVQSFFQPVVSIQTKTIIGFEAFARGVSGEDKQAVKPSVLFNTCHDAKTQLLVDATCRDAALEQFRSIYGAHKNMLLFLNINALGIEGGASSKADLPGKARELGYDLRHLVIEVDEKRIGEGFDWGTHKLYASERLRFSIDDVGAGGIGLDKMFMLKPDFIKINRALFTELDTKPYKTDVLRSLGRAATELGATVVGKGVETEEEAFALLDADIIHQQGFFYTKTKDDGRRDPLEIFREKIDNVHHRYRERVGRTITSKKEMFERYHKLATKLMFKLEGSARDEYPDLAKRLVAGVEELAGLFILDDAGRQVTARLTKTTGSDGKPALKQQEQREDHSIRDYVLYLHMGFEKFVTQPFRSPVTRKPHVIISRRFFNREAKPFIVCAEFEHTAG